MHTCFNVDEIVMLIVCKLTESEAKAAAVALACCCQSFEDPVLDVLWETQEKLLPLLKSLPEDVWDNSRCTSFKRPPTTPEWARFRNYAQRMRRITEYEDLGELYSEVFSALQLHAVNEPLFPNLGIIQLCPVGRELVPFIPLFLSPRTIVIDITFDESDLPKVMVALMIDTFPALCPNLQRILLHFLPRDPMITAAVSRMLLASNRDALRSVRVDSPLTEEVQEVICKLSDLHELMVVIERGTSLPSVVLPNLTKLFIKYDSDSDWLQMFRGATLEKLETFTIRYESEQIGGFLEAFERVALAASAQNTLSEFSFRTSSSWNPNYSSLLLFTQLTCLVVEFHCGFGCPSRVDDDIIVNLARAMPKLEALQLGGLPCRENPISVTAKGLVGLANHCPYLSELCVHFQVASLSAPPAIARMIPNVSPAAVRRDWALAALEVGAIQVPEESVLVVALTLVRIFPHLESIESIDEGWREVMDAIHLSRQIIDHSEATLGGDN